MSFIIKKYFLAESIASDVRQPIFWVFAVYKASIQKESLKN